MAEARSNAVGLGQLHRIPLELRTQIYKYYFAGALVQEDRIFTRPYENGVPQETIFSKKYERNLLLTSKAIYQEAAWVEQSTPIALELIHEDRVPALLPDTTTKITAVYWDDGGFPAHRYPKLKDLRFTEELDIAPVLFGRETTVEDAFSGKRDRFLVDAFKADMVSFGGRPPVSQPEVLPEDFVCRIDWHCWLDEDLEWEWSMASLHHKHSQPIS